jgi:hypothetical protein
MFLIGAARELRKDTMNAKIDQNSIIIKKKRGERLLYSKMMWVVDERAERSVWCESERV